MCSLYKVDKVDKHDVNYVKSFEKLLGDRIKSIEEVIQNHFTLYQEMIISLKSANKTKAHLFDTKLEDDL